MGMRLGLGVVEPHAHMCLLVLVRGWALRTVVHIVLGVPTLS